MSFSHRRKCCIILRWQPHLWCHRGWYNPPGALAGLPPLHWGNGYIKAPSRHLNYLLGSSFHKYSKALRWLFSVSYQGRERPRQRRESEPGLLSLCERGWGGSSSPGLGARSASIDITLCSAGRAGLPGNLKLICFQLTRTADFALAGCFS